MDEGQFQVDVFEQNRSHLRAVAVRMLGSPSEADDAVQESWVRFRRAGTEGVDNLGGWLTSIVSRVCLDMLRSRKAKREDAFDAEVAELLDLTGESLSALDPEDEAVLADSLGPALLLVLETLSPSERLAFVLHDIFAVPFDEIGPMLGRSTVATRQLASRARRRVQGGALETEADLERQREVVAAFLQASRAGDFDALLAVLDPDVVLRADAVLLPSGLSSVVHGAETVAGRARMFSKRAADRRLALVDGAAALATAPGGVVKAVLAFTVVDGLIVEIEVIGDPERLAILDLVLLDG